MDYQKLAIDLLSQINDDQDLIEIYDEIENISQRPIITDEEFNNKRDEYCKKYPTETNIIIRRDNNSKPGNSSYNNQASSNKKKLIDILITIAGIKILIKNDFEVIESKLSSYEYIIKAINLVVK